MCSSNIWPGMQLDGFQHERASSLRHELFSWAVFWSISLVLKLSIYLVERLKSVINWRDFHSISREIVESTGRQRR